MNIIAVIQARMGSTRLPGKVLLPLDGGHILSRVINRIKYINSVDKVVVATSKKESDNIVSRYARWKDTDVYRGSESDVLGRIYNAALQTNADIVVRVTADCPLVSPRLGKAIVGSVAKQSSIEYASAAIERTFPRGIGVEAFTMDSFSVVEAESNKSYQREHVTPFYRDNQEQFGIKNITSSDIFKKQRLRGRTDLRLTVDVAEDYELHRLIYNNIEYESILDLKSAIQFIDRTGIAAVNSDVEQKPVRS